jgi:hypothetical protein
MDTKNEFYFVKFVQFVAETFAAVCHEDGPRYAMGLSLSEERRIK